MENSHGASMDDDAFEKELRKQLAYWQRILYLQDWTIDVRVVRQWDMGDRLTLAQCEWFLQRKDAIIQVLNPHDLPGISSRFLHSEECDYDVSLVHELLHLHFAPFHKDADDVAHEQAINSISRGIVRVWRNKDNEIASDALCVPVVRATEGYL
jgi:hypothetical protein